MARLRIESVETRFDLTAVSSKRGLHLLSSAAEEAERPIVSCLWIRIDDREGSQT